ncbi:MAG: tetratricopeptide repeat protein, partial [Acidobacteriota bacterium]|nr:tetratricopeptide repeat protein [Acidobacteriota bacterium]
MSNVLRGPLVFALLLAVLVGAGLYMRSRSSTASPAQPLSSLQIETKSADPSTLHPSYNDAVAALAAGDVEEARRLCDAVPREDRSYALAQNMAAGIEARTGAFDSALRRLDEISVLQPENPEIHLVRAKTLVLADRGAEAEFEALRALELNPILVSA